MPQKRTYPWNLAAVFLNTKPLADGLGYKRAAQPWVREVGSVLAPLR